MAMPEFKPNFKYVNIGNVVGTLCYAKELMRKDGTAYGHEFLINAKGHGSINVRIPNLEKSTQALENFPVSERPKVRVPLASISMFFAESGKVYTNVNSFCEMSEATKYDGTEMPDSIKGRIGGEIAKVQTNQDGTISALLVIYKTDKEGKLIKNRNGETLKPDVLKVDVVDEALVAEFKKRVTIGSNVEFGYQYINKENTTYDDFGFPIGDGKRIERVEVKKIVVHSAPQQNFEQQFNQQTPPPQATQVDPFKTFGATEVDSIDPFSSNPFGGIEINEEDIPF